MFEEEYPTTPVKEKRPSIFPFIKNPLHPSVKMHVTHFESILLNQIIQLLNLVEKILLSTSISLA
jgi:hypothetical protein